MYRKTKHSSKVTTKSQRSLLFADVSRSLLEVLATVGSPVPGLSELAELTLSIFDKFAKTKENKQNFRELGEEAIAAMLTVANAVEKEEKLSGSEVSESFNEDIQSLMDGIKPIIDLVHRHLNRAKYKRLLYSNLDSDTIEDARKELRRQMDAFMMKLSIATRTACEGTANTLIEAHKSISNHLTHNYNTGNGTFNTVNGSQTVNGQMGATVNYAYGYPPADIHHHRNTLGGLGRWVPGW